MQNGFQTNPGNNYYPSPRFLPKRKVFISYENSDRVAVDEFVRKFGSENGVFIPKMIGTTYGQDIINSTDSDYIIGKIRKDYIGDSTVTILLVGSCTHSRRYVDWELKASLRNGEIYQPNGVMAILLPGLSGAYLPDRFLANYNPNQLAKSFARYYTYPNSADELRSWIEDSYSARVNRANLINNSAWSMSNNAKCKICQITH